MHASIIIKILGSLLMLFSLLANIPPMLVSLFYADGMFPAFFNSLLIILGLGAILFLSTASTKKELGTRDGFLVVTLFWTVLGTAGCLPFFILSGIGIVYYRRCVRIPFGLDHNRSNCNLRVGFLA